MRSAICLATVVLAALGLLFAKSCFAVKPGDAQALRFWDVPGLLEKQEEVLRRQGSSMRSTSSCSRSNAKESLRGELLAGRLGLLVAAARYRDLTLAQPGFKLPLHDPEVAGRGEDEIWIGILLRDLGAQLLRANAPEQRQMLSRLEQEFAHWNQSGALSLPRRLLISSRQVRRERYTIAG